jgi:D-proline reductase (dithiol) PrdB
MPHVESFRYVDFTTRKVMEAWMAREPEREPVWTPLEKPIAASRLAFVSSAAVARTDDRPFDAERERRDPWWGDPSYREIPAATRTADVRLHHLHIDTRPGEEDLDTVLPLRRAEELVADGHLGELAPTHYSFMGFLLRTETFLEESVPAMIEKMRSEDVEAVLLVPV